MTTNLWKRFTERRQRRKQKLADEYSTLSAAERAKVDRLREGHRGTGGTGDSLPRR